MLHRLRLGKRPLINNSWLTLQISQRTISVAQSTIKFTLFKAVLDTEHFNATLTP